MADKKVPVTARGLTQRINRVLRDRGRVLKKSRDRLRPVLGDYFVVSLTRNVVLADHVDLETLGRELGALAPYERLED